MQEAAEAYHDPDLLIAGHTAANFSYHYLGEPIKALEHADRVSALYTEERHRDLVGTLNHDPKTRSLIYAAISTWLLGHPEQAVKIGDAKDAHARRRGHPFDLGISLTFGAIVLAFIGEPDEMLKRADEVARLGRENSLPVLTEVLAPIHMGIALIRKGRSADGIAALKAGLAAREDSGGRLNSPYWKSVLAVGTAQLGDLDGALDLIDESIAQIERPGWEERWCYAEVLRIKGGLLSLKGDLEGAERNFVTSLEWARHQQAKSWELRTATSYALLMRDQGKVSEAYELLAPVYAWFTEGFTTKDLKDAMALLDALSEQTGRETTGPVATASHGLLR
jgi:predicted ATPase